MSSSINNAINNALSGLEAFETGISVISNNIANSNTTGYGAETTTIQTNVTSPGQAGSGVLPAQITRAATGFAAAQLRNANSANAAATAQSTALTAISNALANNGNVQTSMSQFFSDISALAANPSSTALRQTVFSDGQAVSASFQSAAGNLNTVSVGAEQSLSDGVTSANGLLSQLANINKSLQQNPNSPSLIDQQEEALGSLSNYLPINTITQSNGSVLIASGGTFLLNQSGAQNLSVSTSSSGNQEVVAGSNQSAVTLLDSDGSLGSALGTMSAATKALQSLGNVGTAFASQVNQSQAEGLDINGNSGNNLFSIAAPEVTASAGNTGNAQLAASIAGAVNLPVTLTYNNGGWQAVNQNSGQAYTVNTNPLAVAGMALSLTGNPNNGDRFTINAQTQAASNLEMVSGVSTGSIAASDPYVATAGTLQSNGSISDTNAGTITIGQDSVVNQLPAGASAVSADNYGQTLQVQFTSPTAYTISPQGDSSDVIASGTLSNNNGSIYVQYPTSGGASGKYWALPISGTPATGDTLTLQPGGSSSGSNAQRMAALWTSSSSSGSPTLEQSAVSLATGLGANASAAQQLSSATSSQVATATTNLASIAGVNSDQQAVLMTNYEQSYQAAAQVITTAHSMFESLISAV